jgi:signal peptidase I
MKISRRKYITFSIAVLLYSLFVIWLQVYWLLVGILVIMDYFITRVLPVPQIRRLIKLPTIVVEIFDWLGAIITALLFVIVIRTLFIEAYSIPTPSMEKTLMVGDYLFVSKLSYGPKIPNTPLAFPFTHNKMPFSEKKKSYSEKVHWPYKRLGGLGEVRNNDVVVFNFPEGDTVIRELPDQNYYSLIRNYGRKTILSQYNIITHPVDKRENFVKRCIGIPGDRIELRHSDIFINNVMLEESPAILHSYYVRTNGEEVTGLLLKDMGLQEIDRLYDPAKESYVFPLTRGLADTLRTMPDISLVTRLENTNKKLSYFSFFPYSPSFEWTEDNFGPLIVPGKGMSIELNLVNLPLYRRIIEVYEGNELMLNDSSIYINNELQNSYTFGMNYYFMLGDNRHNSADSRIWGFVPEDHIVGKAVFVWLSIDRSQEGFQRFRLNKMFKKIK